MIARSTKIFGYSRPAEIIGPFVAVDLFDEVPRPNGGLGVELSPLWGLELIVQGTGTH